MSYGFKCPCYNCVDNEKCRDAEKIQKAIQEIHMSNDGSHLGAGTVELQCFKKVDK